MKQLNKELDRILHEELDLLMFNPNEQNNLQELRFNRSGGLLFFPRKKLKMQKLKSGLWEPRSWFIEDRLPEQSIDLDLETGVTKQGLTSGLRSAIVREGDRYFRLKGVAPKTYESQRWRKITFSKDWAIDKRGLCTLIEAYNEQSINLYLAYLRSSKLCVKPGFIEFFLPPAKKMSEGYITDFVSSPAAKIDLREPLNQQQYFSQLSSLGEFFDRNNNIRRELGSSFVSALEIAGDTRVDEAFYHLTKRKLTGDKKYVRDKLMKYISFSAGAALSSLNGCDISWGQRLDATNSHLGNFVINSLDGFVQVGITDLDSFGTVADFSSRGKFYNFIFMDLKNFSSDFYADYTTSSPTSLPFREFPNYLRKDCLNAFYTGYVLRAFARSRRDKYQLLILPSFFNNLKLVTPSNTILSEDHFRAGIKYVTE
jgi:hypothetical protein